MRMDRRILTDRGPRLEPGMDVGTGIEPPSASHDMLDDIVHGEGFTQVATGGLAIAVDRAEAEDMIEAFVALSGVEDSRSESSDESR